MVDEFAREALAIRVKRGLNASDGLEVLAELMPARRPPAHIRSDDRPEFAAVAVHARPGAPGVNTAFIEPGRPWENGYVESSNSKLRDELLDGENFHSLKEAQILIEAWRRHDNTVRPHSVLGWKAACPVGQPHAVDVWPHQGPSIAMAARATLHPQSDWMRSRGVATRMANAT